VVVYEKSIATKINDLDLCLEVVSRSCQPLPYIRRRMVWFQRTTNGKWHTGNEMVTWPMMSRDLKSHTRDPQYA